MNATHVFQPFRTNLDEVHLEVQPSATHLFGQSKRCIDMKIINAQLNRLRRQHRTFVLQINGTLKRAMMPP